MKPEGKSLGAAVTTVALFITTAPLSLAQSGPIPLDQLGAVATRQVEGDSLSVSATQNGALLRCAFQRLEGEATPEGLWLTSTADGTNGERFRLMATAVDREEDSLCLVAADVSPLHHSSVKVSADSRRRPRLERVPGLVLSRPWPRLVLPTPP